MNRSGFRGDFDLRLDLSGHLGLIFDTIALFNFARCHVAEFAVQSLLVEPRHPRARGDLKIVNTSTTV